MIRTPRLQPVLRAVALVCLIAAAGLDLCAQLDVRVVRVTTNEAVPFANIAWGVPGSEAKVMATDKEGRARVPCPIDGKGIVIRVSCIGFADHTDTLRTCAPVVVRIQPQALALDPVVVTGQYGPTTADQAVHRVRVIGAEQIRRTAAANLADLMRQELNMSVAQDNVLGSSMDVQGLGGENVKVLVDGVPMIGRLNGDIDLSRVDLSGVERVEIIEGPMSVSYGTNALAGTINLITRRRPKAPTSLGISMQGEHIGRLNTSVTGGRSFGKSDLQLTVGHNFFGGWDPQQGGDLYDPTARVADTSRYQQWKPREQNFGRIGYEWHANERWTIRYKGEAMTDRITARGLPRAPYYESAFDERYRTNALDNMLFVEGGVGRAGSLKAHVAHNRYRRTRNVWLKDLTSLDEQLVTDAGSQDTTWFNLTNARLTFGSARDSALLHYEVGMDVNIEEASGERIGQGNAERIDDYALFASLQWKPVKSITLRPGARAAYNTQYAAPVVPSFNTLWEPAAGWAVRAGWAQGFRSPSIKELYLSFADVNHDLKGNPDLHAERSDHVDLSIQRRASIGSVRLRVEVSGFHNDVRDMITLAQVEGNTYTYVNIGAVRTTGASVRGGGEYRHWSLTVGGTFTGYQEQAVANTGNPWRSTPEAQASLTWKRNAWSATVFGKYSGSSVQYVADDDGVSTRTLGDFLLADANVGHRFWKERMSMVLGCKNLANVTNLQATGAGGAHTGDGGTVAMSTGRTIFLRIDVVFKKQGG